MLVSSHRGSIRSAGFSLIELMIAVVIFAFLVMIAGPMYTTYIGNTHIRAAGEALLNGVRLAHADASASLTKIDITNTTISDPRALSVIISAIGGTQGGTKLCDPGLTAPDPSAC